MNLGSLLPCQKLHRSLPAQLSDQDVLGGLQPEYQFEVRAQYREDQCHSHRIINENKISQQLQQIDSSEIIFLRSVGQFI
jgi:hypothetical protein